MVIASALDLDEVRAALIATNWENVLCVHLHTGQKGVWRPSDEDCLPALRYSRIYAT
jgi:hypothetical protein